MSFKARNVARRSRSARQSASRRSVHFEQLESRELLRASPLFWADTSQLTLSFVADGTDIAGESSTLHELFDSFAPRAQWKSTILRGFQTWAQHTGSNVGVVPERDAWPMGTAGPRTQDSRFGDIRIGGRPLANDVMAIAVAHDTIVSGTWGGDIIFNTNKKFESIEQLYSVSLHEAGHVFGLEHSDFPNSPMYTHGASEKIVPTPRDIADLQQLHGERTADSNEGRLGNQTPRTATPLKFNVDSSFDATVATHLVYGDLTTSHDIDVYSFSLPRNVSGSVRVKLQTRGISLAAPKLSISDAAGVQLANSQSTRVGGATVEVLLEETAPGGTYFIEVDAVANSGFEVGGYSLVTAFETSQDVPTRDDIVEELISLRERNLTQDKLQQLLADNTSLLDVAENVVDGIQTAVNLPPEEGFELYSRYESLGTISSRNDVDYYFFQAADIPGRNVPILNLTVRTLTPGGLIPEATVLNELGNEISSQLLVNGSGEIVLQAAVIPNRQYYVRIRAANRDGLFDRGNYRVTVTFVEDPLRPTVYSAGRIGDLSDTPVPFPPVNVIRPGTDVPMRVEPADVHPPAFEPAETAEVDPPAIEVDAERIDNDTEFDNHRSGRGQVLYVATPQLFHFILTTRRMVDADADQEAPIETVIGTVFNENQERVYTITARPGETRTTNSILLLPGTYHMRFDAFAWNGKPSDNLRYQLQGLTISDPFAVDPDDPSGDPIFDCPNDPGVYCYPGDVVSDDPYLWDDFIDSLPDIPDLETEELVEFLLADWWSWYWDQEQTETPPLGIDDTYEWEDDGSPLIVPAWQGVLSNDVFENYATQLALLDEDVPHGELTLLPDGSFTYVPEPGFVGDVQFTYRPSDIHVTAAATTVILRMAGELPGDLNGDRKLNVQDVDLLCAAILAEDQSPLFDINDDQSVDKNDLRAMIEDVLGTSAGDANLDGSFDSGDLVAVFGINEYEDGIVGNSTWASGDWDCDGEFTTSDLVIAFQAGTYVAG